MRLPRLALGALLLGSPLLSRAQTTEAPAPRFYVGLGAYSSSYQSVSGLPNSHIQVPAQLTAGYQWRPRLAVQLGVAYSGSTYHYTYAGRYYSDLISPTATYRETTGADTRRVASVSLLGRYTLTRKASHHVQFDLLGGFGLEQQWYHRRGTQTDSIQSSFVTSSYDSRNANTALVLTLGPSVRYRFGQRVELAYDLLFSTGLLSNNPYPTGGLTGGQALSLRYRFGRH